MSAMRGAAILPGFAGKEQIAHGIKVHMRLVDQNDSNPNWEIRDLPNTVDRGSDF